MKSKVCKVGMSSGYFAEMTVWFVCVVESFGCAILGVISRFRLVV